MFLLCSLFNIGCRVNSVFLGTNKMFMDRILYRIYIEIKLRLYLFLYLFNNFFINFVYYADAALRASFIR